MKSSTQTDHKQDGGGGGWGTAISLKELRQGFSLWSISKLFPKTCLNAKHVCGTYWSWFKSGLSLTHSLFLLCFFGGMGGWDFWHFGGWTIETTFLLSGLFFCGQHGAFQWIFQANSILSTKLAIQNQKAKIITNWIFIMHFHTQQKAQCTLQKNAKCKKIKIHITQRNIC